MKKAKRVMCIAIMVVMIFAMLLTGCTGKTADNKETTSVASAETTAPATTENPYKDPVKLIYYFLWSNQPDQDKVFAEFNTKLTEKMNTTIDFKPLEWAAWGDKMNVIMASGDPWDLTWACSWLPSVNYKQAAAKGALLALDDLLAKYAPHLIDPNEYPKAIVDGSRINGKLYGVINMQIESRQWGLTFSKAMVDKLNLSDAINNAKTWDDFEPIFETAKKALPDVYILGPGSDFINTNLAMLNYYQYLNSWVMINLKDPSLKAFPGFSDPQVLDFQKRLNSWFTKGYFKSDVLTLKDWTPLNKADKVFCIAQTWKPGAEAEIKAGLGHEVICKLMTSALAQVETTSTMTCVNAQSQYPERAVQFLDLLNSDKEMFNLLAFGREGTDFTKISDNVIDIPADSQYKPAAAWILGNVFNGYVMKGQPEDVWEQTKKVNATCDPNPLSGFDFNQEPVKNEIANIDGVMAKYTEVLQYGYGDQDKLMAEVLDKFNKAGYQKVIDELNSQIAKFTAK